MMKASSSSPSHHFVRVSHPFLAKNERFSCSLKSRNEEDQEEEEEENESRRRSKERGSSSSFLRSSKSFNSISRPSITLIRRKSAVERLQESKAQYVKSEQVRDGRQLLTQSLSQTFEPKETRPQKLPHQPFRSRSISQSATFSSSPTQYLALNCLVEGFTQPLTFATTDSLPKRRTLSTGKLGEPAGFNPGTNSSCNSNVHNLEVQLRQLITSSQDSLGEDSLEVGYSSTLSSLSPCFLSRKSLPDLNNGPIMSSSPSPCPCPCPCPWAYTVHAPAAATPAVAFRGGQSQHHANHANASHNNRKNVCDAVNSRLPVLPTVQCKQESHAFIRYAATHSNASRPGTISRSKSDIGHRGLKSLKPKNKDEMERFFDTLGLMDTWASLAPVFGTNAPSFASTPPHYFPSVDSLDSGARQLSFSSDSIDNVAHEANHQAEADSLEALRKQVALSTSFSLSSRGMSRETSIVEKNARVIKWLYNCRKAAMEGTTD